MLAGELDTTMKQKRPQTKKTKRIRDINVTNDNPPKIIKHTKDLVSVSGIIYRTPMGKNPWFARPLLRQQKFV